MTSEYIPGILNVLPDKLSRIFDLGLTSEAFRLTRGGVEIEEVSSESLQVVDDRDHRHQLLLLAHLNGHFGEKGYSFVYLK